MTDGDGQAPGGAAHSPLSGDADPAETPDGVVLDEPGEPRAAAG